MDLQEIRKQLDVIDREILQLYEKRMDLSRDVAAYKMSVGKPVYDGERERQKLETVENMAQEDYRQGAGGALRPADDHRPAGCEYRLLAEHGQAPDTGFARIDRIPTEGARVVYQGVEGSYSHQASMEYFGEDGDLFHVKTWEEAMRAVEEGRADYGVLPIENFLRRGGERQLRPADQVPQLHCGGDFPAGQARPPGRAGRQP